MFSFVTAVLVLSFMIFIHELGHFAAARRAGVGVEKFSIGFGPKIWGVTRGETQYIISAIPFGGYVKMVGDNPDEELKERERDKSFLLKPVWTRMGIVFAGPASNLLSAIAIIYVISLVGQPTPLAVIGEVKEDFPAAAAGLQPGDRVVAVGDQPVELWEDMTVLVHDSAGEELEFSIDRGGETRVFRITPRATEEKNIFGEPITIGLIGITPGEETTHIRYGPIEGIGISLRWTYSMIKLTLVAIVKMVQRIVPADQLGGPLMIVQAAGKSAEKGLLELAYFVAYVSVALGLFNLFPIPILDGGMLFFFFVEAVRGRPLSIRNREILQQVGMVLLIALMLFATKNDIYRWLKWK